MSSIIFGQNQFMIENDKIVNNAVVTQTMVLVNQK